MREIILAEFHGSGEKNCLGIYLIPPVPLIVETVHWNAAFLYNEALLLPDRAQGGGGCLNQ